LLDPAEQRVLIAMLADIEVFAEIDPAVIDSSPDPYILGMVHSGVPYKPSAWFGCVTNTESHVLGRATRRLERQGLVTRVIESKRDRVTHIRPTVAGLLSAIRAAKEANVTMVAAKEANVGMVAAGLRRTNWGQLLADRLDEGQKWLTRA
jgi:hypothetical protein